MATELSRSMTSMNLKSSLKEINPAEPLQMKTEFNEGRWTKEEHKAFVQGLELYGKEWKKIANLIPTRSIVQIRTHAQKFFQKVARVNFEKQGKQVPDALKSTAIKSSYNFESLQDALTQQGAVDPTLGQEQVLMKEEEDMGLNENTTFSMEPIEAPDSLFGDVKRRSQKSRARSVPRSRSVSSKMTKPARRSRRKSSKFSLDLQHLSLDTSNENEEAESDEFDFNYDFSPAPVLTGFSFSNNRFSESSSVSGSSDEESLTLKKSKSSPLGSILENEETYPSSNVQGLLEEFPFETWELERPLFPEYERNEPRQEEIIPDNNSVSSISSNLDDPLMEFMNASLM